MRRLLLIAYRRGWLTRWELVQLLQALRAGRAAEPEAGVWATPRWVRGSFRRSLFWALCRTSSEQPLLLAAGTVLAAPALAIHGWWLGRAAWRLAGAL